MKAKVIFIMFMLIAFLAGIYAILSLTPAPPKKISENMENENAASTTANCPDMLVQRGNALLLYNSSQPVVDGVNPIPFYGLDDYINYLEIQRKRGQKCPVLYLKMEYNAQGEEVYRMRPSPFDLQGGQPAMTQQHTRKVNQLIDASRENPPFNANNYPGFDPQGQSVGVYTNVDKTHDSTRFTALSDNPMDPNWGGVQYTRQIVNSGKYDDNNVTRPLLFSPNTTFNPQLENGRGGPVDIL
jgi:hypothetical protein